MNQQSSSAQSSSLSAASTFKFANPNSWSYGAGVHNRGASLGEEHTPCGGEAGTLEAANATAASATTSAFNFVNFLVLQRQSDCRARSQAISLSSSVKRMNVFC
jgi:hypothetical protein